MTHTAKTEEYAIVVYVAGVKDSDRMWQGSDEEEAYRQLERLKNRFPGCDIRFSFHQYFDSIKPDDAAN